MEKCFYCENDYKLGLRIRTKDHIIPRSKNGNSSQKNMVFACQKCNSLKGNKLPEDFSLFLEFEIQRAIIGVKRNCSFKIDNLKKALTNNNKLVETIAPYRNELLKSFKFKAVSKNKPTVKQREKILKQKEVLNFTTEIWTQDLFDKHFEGQKHFHYL